MQKHVPGLQNYVQTNCSSVVPMLFQSFGIDNLFESNLWTRDIVCWGFPDSPLWYRHYMQAVIVFQCFFCSLPSKLVYYFRRIYTMWFLPHLFCHHDLFTFQKFFAWYMTHFWFLVSPMTIIGETARTV